MAVLACSRPFRGPNPDAVPKISTASILHPGAANAHLPGRPPLSNDHHGTKPPEDLRIHFTALIPFQ